ncbi:MAG: 30S ribosomal protein S8 [Phycisphaeraceae bacterium]
MALSDPIADMLTRIRNSVRNKAQHVTVRKSKVCVGIAQVLQAEGYIKGFDEIDDGKQGLIRVELKYGPRGEHVIHHINRVSKPSLRVYRGVEDIPRVLDGLGIAIVSTSRGIVSDRRARDERIGGELLCTVE